jgi:hypothetical protein
MDDDSEDLSTSSGMFSGEAMEVEVEGRDSFSVEMESRIEYAQYMDFELHNILQKERAMGFRKIRIRTTPGYIQRFREVLYTFLNFPSSSILVRRPALR